MFGTRQKAENNPHGSSAEYRKTALVIGNSLYHRNSKLNNTVNDANGMCDALQSVGFKVSKGLDLTYSQMQSYINKFIDDIQPNDLVLFYFSGHGTQWEDQNFLVACDDENLTKENITRYAINAQDVLKHMTSCKPFATLSRGNGSETHGLAPMHGDGNTFICFACAPNQTSSDGNRIDKHGTFTKHLLRHITKPNEQLQDLMIDVNRDVIRETDGAQKPWQHMSLTHRDIYLAHRADGNHNVVANEDQSVNHHHGSSVAPFDSFFSNPMQDVFSEPNVHVKNSFHYHCSGFSSDSGPFHREFHGESNGGNFDSFIKQAERDSGYDLNGDGKIG
ncbi:unnamed protein product [Adineta ricciae]|uniref:Caspase family p20 domain-containing protein n=1 Tax=Adineta ricciae TaxID=249248 RepID=A0A815T6K7_ADIRI|nr:unnamed protein product [Adineta ricciae]